MSRRIRPAWRSLLALVAILAVSVLVPASWGTARALSVSQIQVVNLSDHDFWVEWYTDQPVTGSIQYGSSCSTATVVSPEVTKTGFVHLVDVGGPALLSPDTTYYYELIDNGVVDSNGGQCYTVKTFPQMPKLPTPSTIAGSVKADPSCIPPSVGAIVTLDVTHGNTTSLPLAAVTSSDGTWSIPIGLATDATGNYLYPTTGDAVDLTAAAALDNSIFTSTVYNPNPGGAQQLQQLCLPKTPTPIPPTSSVTGTPPTSTPSPTATSPPLTATPTAGPTLTPSPTPSPAPPTSTPPPATAVPPTATPRPTARPKALPKHAPVAEVPSAAGGAKQIKLRAYLAKPSVPRGTKQQLVVMTVGFAQVSVDVSYPNHGGVFHSSFRANKSGYWKRTWVVSTRQTGTATVLVTVVSGKDVRRFHRYFTVQ